MKESLDIIKAAKKFCLTFPALAIIDLMQTYRLMIYKDNFQIVRLGSWHETIKGSPFSTEILTSSLNFGWL